MACVFVITLKGLPAQGQEQAQDSTGSSDENAFLILQTNLQPPYQQLQNGILRGYSIAVLNCAFERIGVGYGIAIAPRQRNREMVRNGQADGFFLARISTFMDQYAEPTLPLALEKWVWISAAGQQGSFASSPTPDSLLSVGAILGSNEAEWLAEQGYQEIAKAPSINSLISQVLAGRVEYALVDKQTFEAARDSMGNHEDQFNVQFERYAPLVVYIGREYTRLNPGLIASLNTALGACETLPMQLEDWERDLITRQQLPAIRAMAANAELVGGYGPQWVEHKFSLMRLSKSIANGVRAAKAGLPARRQPKSLKIRFPISCGPFRKATPTILLKYSYSIPTARLSA